MKRSIIETVLGAVVLVLAGVFLVFSYRTADISKVSGYEITAAFSGIGGLAIGDDVRISGVKIGSVNNVALNNQNYLAVVTMAIDPTVKLPEDTAAIISSESLLGGRYLEIQPGASDEMLQPGQQIKYTQAPQNLEQLLGKFIFNMQPKKDGQSASADEPAAEAPVPVVSSDTPVPSEDNAGTAEPAPAAEEPKAEAAPETAAPAEPAIPETPAAEPQTAAPAGETPASDAAVTPPATPEEAHP